MTDLSPRRERMYQFFDAAHEAMDLANISDFEAREFGKYVASHADADGMTSMKLPIQWHQRAIEQLGMPGKEGFKAMQASSWAVKQILTEEQVSIV